MDISPSAFPSLPLLVHGFDGAFPSSEESTPADSPMFYKYGEPSRLPGMKPMSHLSPNDTYKVWDSNLRGKEIDLSYSACHDSKQIWEEVEMEIDAMPYVSPCTRRPHDAATQWPIRDNTASSSNTVIGARPSLFCSQPSQTSVGADWCESPLKDDFYGPVSTLTSAALFEGFDLHDGSSPSLVESQPHNYHYNSTSSPSLYRFPASTQPVSILSPITIPSPSSSPSLDSTSSYSSSSSLSSCPPTPPTPVLLPELRQPRPARPIPIIPLSNLATACEKAYVPSPKSSSGFPKSRRSFCESESSDLISSVFPKPGTRYPLFPLGQISHDALRFQSTGEGKPNSTYVYINSWSGHSR